MGCGKAQANSGESYCAKFPDGGFCLPVCNPTSPTCRKGYKCINVAGFNANPATQTVCSADASQN